MRSAQDTSRLARWLRQHRDGVRFCLRFSCYMILAFVLLSAMYDRVVVPLTRCIAWLTHTLLRATGTQSWVSGATVGVPGFAVEIKNNCNAIYEIGLYSAAVWAYPAPLLQRVSGVLLGTIMLSLINLIRVLSLLALGRYWPWGFQAAHVYVWQALFLAVVTACWLGWVSRVRPVA